MRSTIVHAAALAALVALAAPTFAAETWTRNTFPGEGHAVHGFPAGQGQDRTEWWTCFTISPHQYDEGMWILMATDLGPLVESFDGTADRLASFQVSQLGINGGKQATFDPHDKLTAYFLAGNGMHRTRDKGKTWEQIWVEPDTERGMQEHYSRPSAPHEIISDPHPDRAGHLYYAHARRGLYRTRLSHDDEPQRILDSWELLDFSGRMVKGLAAGVDGDRTLLYVTVVPDSVKRRSYGTPGEAWLLTITGDGQVERQRIFESLGDTVTCITTDPRDGTRGYVIGKQTDEQRGVFAFSQTNRIDRLAHQTARSYALPEIVAINPANPDHVVIRIDRKRHKPERGFIAYSSDGGRTWAGEQPDTVTVPYTDANGTLPSVYIVDVKHYGPTNWRGDNPNLKPDQRWATDMTAPWIWKHPRDRHPQPNIGYGNSWGGEGGGGNRGIAFIPGDPDDVVVFGLTWIREMLKSDNDYGATLTPHGYGLQFKQPLDVAFGSTEEVVAVCRAEHGLHLTRDGGLTWRGITHFEDPTLEEAVHAARGSFRMKSCTSAGFDPDDDDALLISWGTPDPDDPAALTILYSDNFGESWKIVHTVGETIDRNLYGTDGTRLVWGQNADGEDRIYTENYRCTDPGTWTFDDIGRRLVDVHAEDADIVVGTLSSTSGNAGMEDQILAVSLDAGDTWVDLPKIPEEVCFTQRGGKFELEPRAVNFLPRNHRPVAIDPSDRHNPNASPDARLRLLVAGRSGVYEYVADRRDGSGGAWRLLNGSDFHPLPGTGQLTEDSVGKTDPTSGLEVTSAEAVGPRPYLAQVVFDPSNPDIVYASQGGIRTHMGMDSHRNPNLSNPSERFPEYPIYRSTDGGRSWELAGGTGFPGLPKFIDPDVINVGPQGTFFVEGYSGEYRLDPPQ